MKRLAPFILVIVLITVLCSFPTLAADPGDITFTGTGITPTGITSGYYDGDSVVALFTKANSNFTVEGDGDLSTTVLRDMLTVNTPSNYSTYFDDPVIEGVSSGVTLTGIKVTFPLKANTKFYEQRVDLTGGITITETKTNTSTAVFYIDGILNAREDSVTGFNSMNTDPIATFSHYTNVDFSIPVQSGWFTLNSGTLTDDSLTSLSPTATYNGQTISNFAVDGLTLKGTLPSIAFSGSGTTSNSTIEVSFTLPGTNTPVNALDVTVTATKPSITNHPIAGVKNNPAITLASLTSSTTDDAHWARNTTLYALIDNDSYEYSDDPNDAGSYTLTQQLAYLKGVALVDITSSLLDQLTSGEFVVRNSQLAIALTSKSNATSIAAGENLTVGIQGVTGSSVTIADASQALRFYSSSSLNIIGTTSAPTISSSAYSISSSGTITSTSSFSVGNYILVSVPYSNMVLDSGATSASSAYSLLNGNTTSAINLVTITDSGGRLGAKDLWGVNFNSSSGNLDIYIPIKSSGSSTFTVSFAGGSPVSNSFTFTAVTITNTAINGISDNIDLATKVYLDGEDITGTDLGSLTVNPGDELLLYLYTDMFTWTNGAPSSVITVPYSLVNTSKFKVNMSGSSKTIVDSVSIYKVDTNTAAIRVKFADTLNSTSSKSFTNNVRFYYSSSLKVTLAIGGTFENAELEDDFSAGDSIDMTENPIVISTSTARNVELDLGSGVYVTTTLRANRRTYVALRDGTDDEYDDIQNKYSSIEDIYHIDSTNLADDSTVVFDRSEFDTLYIYDADGTYLGTTGEKLALSKTYYLSNKRINMSIGSSSSGADESDSSTAPPSESESSSGTGNFNPPTGVANLPGTITAMAVCALMGFGCVKLLKKKED